MPHDATVTICGRRWKLVYCSSDELPRNTGADCDPPTLPKKQIRVWKGYVKQPEELLEKLIHEGLHAADWTKDEEWITEVAHDLARLLWKQGFRLGV